MASTNKRFPAFTLWGSCSRCGRRTRFTDLARERLTGLLVCTVPVGKPRACFDPWPEVFDFQVEPDRSIEPPPEPLPTQWMLDDVFSTGPYHPVTTANALGAGTPASWAGAPKAAPSDAARLRSFMKTQFQSAGTVDFSGYRQTLNQNQDRDSVVTVNSLDYDGTFVPSSSVRTVAPPESPPSAVGAEAGTSIPFAGPPWAAAKGV